MIIPVILITTILSSMFLSGCLFDDKPASSSSSPTTSTTANLQSRLESVESRLNALENTVGSLNTEETDLSDIQSRLDSLQSQVNSIEGGSDVSSLQEQIDDLYDQVDALTEGEDNDGSSSSFSGEIRWRFDNPIVYNYATDDAINDADLMTDVRADSSRVLEEGIYYLDLTVTNMNSDPEANPIDLGTCYFSFSMRPYSYTDYALLDEDKVYLDTDEPPYLSWTGTSFAEPSWDAFYDIREREGQDVTKKVTFESERCSIGDLKGTIKITLFLELYYAD